MTDTDELRQENDALRSEVNRLTDQVERLEDEKTELEGELETSIDDIRALREENAQIGHSFDELRYEHEQLRETYEGLHTDVGSVVRQMLEQSGEMDSDALSAVFARFVVETESLAGSLVAGHPSAGPDLWRWMIRYNAKAGAPAVASIRQALQDAGVREALLSRSKNPRHWARCCLFAEGEELEATFEQILEVGPGAAAQVLAEEPALVRKLGEEHLAKLLQSEDTEVRRQALMAAQHLDGPDPELATQPRDRSTGPPVR